jgi:hypothetical protein
MNQALYAHMNNKRKMKQTKKMHGLGVCNTGVNWSGVLVVRNADSRKREFLDVSPEHICSKVGCLTLLASELSVKPTLGLLMFSDAFSTLPIDCESSPMSMYLSEIAIGY